MRPARPGLIALVVAALGGGVAILLAWGWRSLAVYAFFVAIATLLSFGIGLGGRVLTDVSRGRFGRGDR